MLLGLLLVPGPALGQALPSPPLPRGFIARDEPGASARVLTTAETRSGSAIGVLRERLTALAGYFDKPPALSVAITDDRDQHVQAFFSASLGEQPVAGVLVVETGSGRASPAQANATRASLSAAEGWDQVIRGVQTIENPRSGFRAEVPNDKAQRWVDRLNESGTGHWRVVPASELVRP